MFAKDHKIIIYRDYQQVGLLEYTQVEGGNIEPLQLIFEKSSSKLILLASINKKMLHTFEVDVVNQAMKDL